jgi:DNA-directed RNA polymerase specialized sigma24 family protein
MNARDFLKQLKKLNKMIENKLNEKEQWKSMATGTTAQMGGERVQTSGSQQKMADAVARFVDIDKEIDECIDRLIDTKKDVIAVIEQLNASEYDLLHKIYVQFFTVQEVADLYDRSISWAKTIHKRGLKNVQRILDDRRKEP